MYKGNRNKFAEFFKHFISKKDPELFFELSQMSIMQTMSIMMLERFLTEF
jgi:hypothetical protein